MDIAAGCAFLKYETKEQAVAAIEALNGTHKIEVRRNKCFQKIFFLYYNITSLLLSIYHVPLSSLTGSCSSVTYELSIIAFQSFQIKDAQCDCNLKTNPLSTTHWMVLPIYTLLWWYWVIFHTIAARDSGILCFHYLTIIWISDGFLWSKIIQSQDSNFESSCSLPLFLNKRYFLYDILSYIWWRYQCM